jgi:hypothetical protein
VEYGYRVTSLSATAAGHRVESDGRAPEARRVEDDARHITDRIAA